jgi:hypothetical protein
MFEPGFAYSQDIFAHSDKMLVIARGLPIRTRVINFIHLFKTKELPQQTYSFLTGEEQVFTLDPTSVEIPPESIISIVVE